MESFLLPDTSAPKLEAYYANGGRKRLRYQVKKESGFWLEYISQLENHSLTTPYAEITPAVHPVVISLTISFRTLADSFSAEIYSMNLADNLIITTQNALRKLLSDSSSDEDYLTSFLVASKSYSEEDDISRVVYRLHFPLCRMENVDQHKFLRAELLVSYRKNNILTELGLELITTKIDEILHTLSIGAAIPIYGSSAYGDNRGAPHTTLIYSSSGKLVQNWDDVSEKFDYKAHDATKKIIDDKRPWATWLPIVLSITYSAGEVYTPKQIANLINDDAETLDEKYRPPDQLIAVQMLDIIPSGYATAGWKRKLIGKALYNVYNGTHTGCKEWIDWCRGYKDLSPYDDEYFIKKYKLFSGRNTRRIVTLQQIAQQENPTEYKRWFDERFYELLVDAGTSRTPVAVARLAYHYFKTKVTFVGRQWYTHTGSFLKPITFNRTHLDPITERIKIASEQEGVPRRGAILNYEGLLKSMETPGFLSSVKMMLMDIINTYTFGVMVNSDGLLTATAETYVSEIKKRYGSVERRGLLEDYLTHHSEVCYDPKFSETDSASIRERQFSRRLLNNDDALRYMDWHRAKDFRAPSGEKSLEIHIGATNSGKTTNLKIDKRMFGGNQLGHMPTALTSTQSHGGPSPETAHTNFVKRVVFEDPDDVDTKNLNEGWILRETGQANRLSRFLNENGGDSEASGNYIFAINDNIAFSPTGQMQIRLFIFSFTAAFFTKDDAVKMGRVVPDTIEEQEEKRIFPRVNFTEEDWLEMARVRLNRSFILMHKMDWTRPLDRPDIITQWTVQYWCGHDPYSIFKAHYLKESSESKIHVDLLYAVFASWFKKKYHVNQAPNFRAFIKCMKGVLHRDKDQKDFYHGFRIEDPVFNDFVNNCLRSANDTDYLDAKTAWFEFRQWCEMGNIKSHAQNLQDFITYMSSSVVEYVVGQGFPGFSVAARQITDR